MYDAVLSLSTIHLFSHKDVSPQRGSNFPRHVSFSRIKSHWCYQQLTIKNIHVLISIYFTSVLYIRAPHFSTLIPGPSKLQFENLKYIEKLL